MPRGGSKPYLAGTGRERAITEKFIPDGWYVVRSAGSHGYYDLVLTKGGYTVFVQVKTKYKEGEVEQYIELAKSMSIDTILFWKISRGWFGQYTRWFGDTYGSYFDDIRAKMNEVAREFAYVLRGHDVQTLEEFV